MRTRSKLLLAAVAATALLGIAVSSASANRLEIPNWEKGFKLTWSALTLEAGGSRIVCPVTLEGGFSAHTIVKRARTSIGTVTRAARGTCTEGTATILTETLPWDVEYSSYGGTLPTIESVTLLLIRASFRATNGITCLAGTEAGEPGRGRSRITANEISSLEADPSALIGVSGGFFCEFGTKAHFAGTATAKTSEGANIRIRLI